MLRLRLVFVFTTVAAMTALCHAAKGEELSRIAP